MTAGGAAGVRQALLEELHVTLSVAHQAVRDSEQRVVEAIAVKPASPIVLFGAGNLGRRTLSLLRAQGRDIDAFLDNDPRLWGSVVDGVPVLSPEDGASRFSKDGLVIVTIWRAEGGHDFIVTRDTLLRQGWTWVESFVHLYWGYPKHALPYITIDRPTKVLDAMDDVLATADLWSDERSLREYVGQVRWRLSGDFAALSPAEPNQYFADGLVQARSDEVFVDCGAFTGDTVLDVASRVGSWRAYHAFEPDPVSFAALQNAVRSMPASLADRVHLHNAATADRQGTARFSATGLGSAQLSIAGEFEVDCIAIDDVVVDPPPTFIKMDIEGAERDALVGATTAICNGRPLLAIAAYHKQADLWQLPRLVSDMGPDYSHYLRPHAAEGFDAVLYALPPDRHVAVGMPRR